MALIKHAQSDALVRDAIVLDLAQLGRQAEELIAHAEARAARVIADAQRERDRLLSDARETGRAQGHAEGHAKGLDEGRAQGLEEARASHNQALTELANNWAAALARFERDRDDLLLHARTDALALALEMGRRITGRIVETDPGVVAAQLERVLALVANPTRLVLRVHPDDLARAESELPALKARFDAATHAELVADPAVTRGSCVARSARGEIDASIETQLDRIAEALLPVAGVEPSAAASALADNAIEPPPEPPPEPPAESPPESPPPSPDARGPDEEPRS